MYENIIGSKRDHGTPSWDAFVAEAEGVFNEYETPDEFKSFVLTQAWDIGHSSGYSEVLIYVKDFAYDLSKAIKSYKIRIVKESTENRQIFDD
jgi:hypothetical protein